MVQIFLIDYKFFHFILQLSLEREEQERQELRRIMLSGSDDKKTKDKKKEEDDYLSGYSNNQTGKSANEFISLTVRLCIAYY